MGHAADHLAWGLGLLAVAILAVTLVRQRAHNKQLRFHVERHGLRLRKWARVSQPELRDPWRCPECYTTVHGHWAKVRHQQWHDEQEGREQRTELWDAASSGWLADRDAGTPALEREPGTWRAGEVHPEWGDRPLNGAEADALNEQERQQIEQ